MSPTESVPGLCRVKAWTWGTLLVEAPQEEGGFGVQEGLLEGVLLKDALDPDGWLPGTLTLTGECVVVPSGLQPLSNILYPEHSAELAGRKLRSSTTSEAGPFSKLHRSLFFEVSKCV